MKKRRIEWISTLNCLYKSCENRIQLEYFRIWPFFGEKFDIQNFFFAKEKFSYSSPFDFASRDFLNASRNISFTLVVAQSRVSFSRWTNRFTLSTSESKSESSIIKYWTSICMLRLRPHHARFNLSLCSRVYMNTIKSWKFQTNFWKTKTENSRNNDLNVS